MNIQLPSNFPQTPEYFWNLGLTTIKELEIPQGILASGREEIYGCIFGRDSLISSLKLLRTYRQTKNPYFLGVVKKILTTLAVLQGKTVNIESGEEPGKCIHEFRTANYEHLTNHPTQPWYLYPDKIMRNFDSVDATPLFLIAAYRFWQKSEDQAFLDSIMPQVELALDWLTKYGDSNNDGFIDYQSHPLRKYGGLKAQNWMDSQESVFHEDGQAVAFPVAPVEVQGYAYLALRLWSLYFAGKDQVKSGLLNDKAQNLKALFNQKFVLGQGEDFSIATALDGEGRPLTSVRSSMGHLLWASLNQENDGITDCVLNEAFVPQLVQRLLKPDLFESEAGVRTLSKDYVMFSANSYHNGSIWPHDNSLIAEGLEKHGFTKEAAQVGRAMLKALDHFGTPIELFVYENGQYQEYCSPQGQRACKKQAWSAASLLTASLALQNSRKQT